MASKCVFYRRKLNWKLKGRGWCGWKKSPCDEIYIQVFLISFFVGFLILFGLKAIWFFVAFFSILEQLRGKGFPKLGF